MARRIRDPEVVYGSEPCNNGDYSFCEGCKGYVHIDFWDTQLNERGEPTFLHRGHLMDVRPN